MNLVKVCPPGSSDPDIKKPRIFPPDYQRRTLRDSLPLKDQADILVYHQAHPYEQAKFEFDQAGPYAIPGAVLVISMAYYEARSILREYTSDNMVPTPPVPNTPLSAGPFLRIEDTYIAPLQDGYRSNTPNYKPIKPEDRDPKMCYFQDKATGIYYIRAGYKGKTGYYPFQRTSARILAGGIIYPGPGHGYYLREPKPGAVPVAYTSFKVGGWTGPGLQ